jgi:hypothetical protein
MKKLIVILMLVALAGTPALAAVTISGTTSSTTGTVNYSVTGPNSVRAFALDITLSSGTIGGVTCSNASYYIYPGSISILAGSVAATGTCVCSATQFPGKGQGGVGTAGVTVEMGSLYTGSNKPASSGTLLTFTVSATPCTATVAANSARGGVVMENPDESPAANLPITIPFGPGDCYPSSRADYSEWTAMGKPTFWCAPWQCHGDADNATEISGKGTYHVGNNDLTILLNNWLDKAGVPAACQSDFDHHSEISGKGTYRCGNNDLTVLLNNWLDKAAAAGDCMNP